MTIGDVVWTPSSVDAARRIPHFLDHEFGHTWQWARDGAMFAVNWLAMRELSGVLDPASFLQVGGGGCMNLYEAEAGAFQNSGYSNCDWDNRWN